MSICNKHLQEKLDLLSSYYVSDNSDFLALVAYAVEAVAEVIPACSQVSLWVDSTTQDGFVCAALYKQNCGLLDAQYVVPKKAFNALFTEAQKQCMFDASQLQERPETRLLRDNYLAACNITMSVATAIRFNGQLVAVLNCEYEQASSVSADEKQFLFELGERLSFAYLQHEYEKISQEQQSLNAIQQRLFIYSPDAILILKEGLIQACNKSALVLFSATDRQQLVGLSPVALSPEYQPCGQTSQSLADKMMLPENSSFERFDWVYDKLSGESFDAEMSLSTVAIGGDGQEMAIIRDISQQKRHQQKLKHLAYSCALTGLANRAALLEFCDETIAQDEVALSLLALDINNFKSINQSLGQATGDAVLQEVARRLQAFFEDYEDHCVARIGGNEFAVALTKNSNKMKLRLQAESLRHQLEQPVMLDDMALSIAATISICAYPEDGIYTGDVLGALSLSMEAARSSFVAIKVAGQANENTAEVRRLLLTQLETAINDDQLSLYYQPKLDLSSNRCIGFEALLRWHHPDKGLVPPGDFIPLVEKTRLITPLTHWVIKSACQQLHKWLQINPETVVAVNLSTRNLLDQNLPGFIAKELALYNIAPRHLQLEVTESSMMADPERSIQTINDLHDLGTPLSIDDYGTGHSSLAYLRSLPVQVLKIDKTFIADVLKFEHDRIIVESIITLAHSLGLSVVAEGVEDKETLAYLSKIGCDEIQGYYFSHPLPAADAASFLQR